MGLFTSGRSGPTQNDLALRGLAMLGVFAAVLFGVRLATSGAFADTSGVTTRLDTAGGSLAPGSDVKLHGLAVGTVAGITGDARGVTVHLDIQNDSIDDIPESVHARVLPATVFGTSFVDLVPPASASGRSLQAGDVIRQDTSTPTLELQQALDSIDRLVDALGPAELSTALHTMAAALDGRGEQLGRTLDLVGRYLARLQPEMPTVREDLRLLASNLGTLRRTAPDLLSAVDDLVYVGAHVVDRRAQLTSLLSGGTSLVQDADRFLNANDEDLVRVIRQAAVVTDAVYDQRVGLRTGLLALVAVSTKIQTVGEGQWARVEGHAVDPKYHYYTAADCPRYGSAQGANCHRAGRAAVSHLVAGSLGGGRR